jgi:hypothetical protein
VQKIPSPPVFDPQSTKTAASQLAVKEANTLQEMEISMTRYATCTNEDIEFDFVTY